MSFILSCIKGIALGAGAILPGVSSGVLCVIFGLYEKLINSILGFFSDVKGNLKFLLPIVIGICIGVVIFGNILKILFINFPIQTQYTFIGLILGSVPVLFKTANSKGKFRLHYIFYTLLTFFIAIFLIMLENGSYFNNSITNTNFLFLVLSGFIMSIGVVFPGISSSVLLMILGVYNTYIVAVSTVDIAILFPLGIGLLMGGFVFLIITRYCLNNYFSQTYYSIIGFVLGSILILYPGFTYSFETLTGIFCFLVCFYIAYKFEKSSN